MAEGKLRDSLTRSCPFLAIEPRRRYYKRLAHLHVGVLLNHYEWAPGEKEKADDCLCSQVV